jgi:hypothetical protein
MTRFAENTTVPSDRSRAEIEKTLTRYGASSFMYGTTNQRAIVAFEMNHRRIKFDLPMPDRRSEEFVLTKSKRLRGLKQQDEAYEQAVRQRWRALALVIKAKLEAVECGITEFEEEFLAHIVLPNGSTVGQFMLPQIKNAYDTGNMPPLLEGPK